MQVLTRAFLFVLLAALFSSCGKHTPRAEYRIGMDTSWYPLELGTRDHNVTAFSTELLKEISVIENVSFIKVSVNGEDLFSGLQRRQYDAIFSSLTPYIFNENTFAFSDVYLPLGPVLVVPFNSSIQSMEMLGGKEIGVISGSKSALLLEKIPDVLIRYYDSIPRTLDDLVMENIDGALIGILPAVAYCRDIYQGQLKIVSDPLTSEGLRLLIQKTGPSDLIQIFDAGLKKLKASGAYQELLIKWGLQEKVR